MNRVIHTFIALAILAASASAVAQAFPSKPIRLLMGAVPVGNSPTEFTAFVREDIKRWAPVVKYSGAKPE